MNILTTTDTALNGRRFEKKQKNCQRTKNSMSPHKTHFHFFADAQTTPKKMKECFSIPLFCAFWKLYQISIFSIKLSSIKSVI